MSEFNIEVQGGSSVRLPTAGKYCEKDIIVTASGGGGTEEIENLIDKSEVLGTTDETVTVTEKVEQLIDKAEDENIWYEHFKNHGCTIQTTWGFFANFKGTSLPRIDVSTFTRMQYFLSEAKKLERVDFYLNSELASNFTNCFYSTTSLKFLKGVNTSNATNVSGFFADSNIEVVEEPFDFSKVTNTSYFANGCSTLREIRFVPETIKTSIILPSPVLSAESIQSIIDGLATVTTAQTLTLHADVKAKLTQTQLATITSKNWNLA